MWMVPVSSLTGLRPAALEISPYRMQGLDAGEEAKGEMGHRCPTLVGLNVGHELELIAPHLSLTAEPRRWLMR